MIQKKKCGCIFDVKDFGIGFPCATVEKECRRHKEARNKRIEEYMRKKRESKSH